MEQPLQKYQIMFRRNMYAGDTTLDLIDHVLPHPKSLFQRMEAEFGFGPVTAFASNAVDVAVESFSRNPRQLRVLRISIARADFSSEVAKRLRNDADPVWIVCRRDAVVEAEVAVRSAAKDSANEAAFADVACGLPPKAGALWDLSGQFILVTDPDLLIELTDMLDVSRTEVVHALSESGQGFLGPFG